MRQPVTYRLARWTGFILAGFTALGLLLNTSALAVLLDLRLPLLMVSAAAVPALAVVFGYARSVVARIAAVAAMLLVGATALLMAWDLTFAYRTEEMSFTNGEVTLRGTLYLPRSAGPHPAVILVHGSGRQTRREQLYYARAYARRGIAALAYDKRGSGASSGNLQTATYQDMAGDATSAVAMLRQRHDVRDDAIGIRGLSEGEWVGTLAALETQAAFLVLISASAMTPAEQVGYETDANVRRAGFSAEDAQRARELYARLSAFHRNGSGRDALNDALEHARTQPWFEAARYLEPRVPPYDQVLKLEWFPAWRARMDVDPLPLLARLDCPVLALVGDNDPKNDGAAALARIEAALAQGSNSAFTGHVYPDAGHGLVVWRLPFGLPPPWLASGALDTELEWVERQVAAREGGLR